MKEKNHLILPFILNLTFTVFEFIGGLLTNSIALISDSIHDIGDSISIGISMILQKKSKKPSDDSYTYGYIRYSLLGGLISSIVLIIGSIVIIYEAVPRLFSPAEIKSGSLLLFAIIGVLVNFFAAFRSKKGSSINEKVISLHLFEDAFGWLALLIGALLIYFFGWSFIDPVLSILFTLFIAKHVFDNLKSIIKIFLEVAPSKPSREEVLTKLKSFDAVLDVHHIHLWTMDGEQTLATMHVVLRKEITNEEYVSTQKELHHELHHLGIVHPTIEFEFEGALCEDLDCIDQLTVKTIEHHHHHH